MLFVAENIMQCSAISSQSWNAAGLYKFRLEARVCGIIHTSFIHVKQNEKGWGKLNNELLLTGRWCGWLRRTRRIFVWIHCKGRCQHCLFLLWKSVSSQETWMWSWTTLNQILQIWKFGALKRMRTFMSCLQLTIAYCSLRFEIVIILDWSCN